jgi:hypothetical protein
MIVTIGTQALSRLPPRRFGARYCREVSVGFAVTALPTALSATADDGSSRKMQERMISRFRLTDWIVPPVIVPMFLLLLVLAAALLRGWCRAVAIPGRPQRSTDREPKFHFSDQRRQASNEPETLQDHV